MLQRKSVLLPIGIVLLTVVLVLLLKLVQPAPNVISPEEKTWSVDTSVLTGQLRSPQIKLYARVESPLTANLTAAINADVLSLDAREGAHVERGQKLLQLDDTDARIVYEEKLANFAELEAAITLENNRYKTDLAALKLEKSLVTLAETKLAREKKTSKSNLTSQSSLDIQKQALQNQKLLLQKRQLSLSDHSARLAQLQAKLRRSQALLDQAVLDINRTVVTAPFDGVILQTSVSPGERVRQGEALISLYAIDEVELRAQLPQRYVPMIKQVLAEGGALVATMSDIRGDILLPLNRVSGAVSSSGSGVDALFSMTRVQAGAVTIGEILEITLTLPALSEVFAVPVSSIYGTNRLYRVIEGRLDAVTVEIVGNQFEQDKQFILVRSQQLKAGDRIITTQLPHAINGLKVELKALSAVDTGET